MEICSQHADCNQVTRQHGERIAKLETRVERIEEGQNDMVEQLGEAAAGLRALASKIDTAISTAKKEVTDTIHSEQEAEQKESFTGSLNKAFCHLRNNFAMFFVYSMAGGFVWFLWKSVMGDWKWDSNVLKMLHKVIGL